MANCRHCGKPLDRIEGDICPHCGTLHPIEAGYETMDITRSFSKLDNQEELYRSKKKSVALALGFALNFFGAMEFYLGKKKLGLLLILITLALTAGIGLALAFLSPLGWALSFLIPFALSYLISIIPAIALSVEVSPKDENGELLR